MDQEEIAQLIDEETNLPALLAVLEAAERAFASWQNEKKDPFDVHFAMSKLLTCIDAARRQPATGKGEA